MSLNFLRESLPASIRFPMGKMRRSAVQTAGKIARALARVNPAPIIVIGNQKSGTTAIAALLGRLAGLSTTLDMYRANRDRVWIKVWNGTIPFDQFIESHRYEFSRRLIKEPNLTVFYPLLARRFPQARFIFIVRDPRDNIRSILNWIRVPGDLNDFPIERMQNMEKTWPWVLDGSWLGLAGENYIEMLAARWDYLAGIYLDHSAQMTLVRYEDFLNDKIGFLKQLAQNLGLECRRDISDQIDHQFRPAGDRSARWRSFFGMANLRRISDICADRMKTLGYDPKWEENSLIARR